MHINASFFFFFNLIFLKVRQIQRLRLHLFYRSLPLSLFLCLFASHSVNSVAMHSFYCVV